MVKRFRIWTMGFVLMAMTVGCRATERQGTSAVNPTPPLESVSALDVVAHLTSQGLDAEVKATHKGASTPGGTADKSAVVAEQKEITVDVFATPADALQAFEGRMHPRWPRPTTFVLWRNAFIVVTNSDDPGGTRIVGALKPVAERIELWPRLPVGGPGPDDVVAKLQAKGLQAKATGERLTGLFGAAEGQVILVEGIPIQVYSFANGTSAERAYNVASNPQANTVEWIAEPHFVPMGNLLITVITKDREAAARIVAALEAVH